MVHRPACVRYHPDNYHLILEAIKEHFNYQYNRGNSNLIDLKIIYANIYVNDIGLVLWPKRFKDKLKTRFPSQRSARVARLNDEHERVLYVQAFLCKSNHL